jgi:outer membrane lipopolysaccharide assembly protein LptE/RlpB
LSRRLRQAKWLGRFERPTGVYLATLLSMVVLLSGCGYHVAGRAANLPSTWHTIAVPALVNKTPQYRVEQRMTEAVIRELISRTKYRVVQDPNSADAVLRGEVVSIETSPILFDARTGQVTTMLVTIHAQAQLVDNHTQQTVYKSNDLVFRDEYQITADIRSFFEEKNPAIERMSRDFAVQFVSDVLENF